MTGNLLPALTRAALLPLLVLVFCPSAGTSQMWPSDPEPYPVIRFGTLEDDLNRVLQITGRLPAASRVLRRPSNTWFGGPVWFGSPAGDEGAEPAWAAPLAVVRVPASFEILMNSGYPVSVNDGLLWGGRGFGAQLTGGAAARWGPVSAAFVPELAWQQNADFVIREVGREGFSIYAYPYGGGIDFPQRMGQEASLAWGLGQSHVKVGAYGFAAGLSTENLWWGPASRYPLLMSTTAPGFPHAFAGTSRPVSVGIGTIEAELIWGRLSESEHFDSQPENDHPLMVGLVAAFSPELLPGLTLGGVRVYQYPDPEGTWLTDPGPITEVIGSSGMNRPGNELFSIFGRWVFEDAGAEIYGEWGRDDRWLDLDEFIQEPDHSQAYMAGFQKVTPLSSETALRVQGEIIALQEKGELTRTGSRPLPVWYTHSAVRQGYTYRGQILGAGIGPGSDAQFVAVDAVRPWGLAGGFLERVRRNDASRAAINARAGSPYEHDTELGGGARVVYRPRPGVVLSGRLSFAYRYNRDFMEADRNFGLSLRATIAPAGGEER